MNYLTALLQKNIKLVSKHYLLDVPKIFAQITYYVQTSDEIRNTNFLQKKNNNNNI